MINTFQFCWERVLIVFIMIFLVSGVTDAEELCIVQSTAANIREEPREKCEKIGTLRKGQLILVREWQNELKDESKKEPGEQWARCEDNVCSGWVHGKLISAISPRNENVAIEYEQLMENLRELGKSMIQAILILLAINGYMIKLMTDHARNKDWKVVKFAAICVLISIFGAFLACAFTYEILNKFILKFEQIKPILQLENELVFEQAQYAIIGFCIFLLTFIFFFAKFSKEMKDRIQGIDGNDCDMPLPLA